MAKSGRSTAPKRSDTEDDDADGVSPQVVRSLVQRIDDLEARVEKQSRIIKDLTSMVNDLEDQLQDVEEEDDDDV